MRVFGGSIAGALLILGAGGVFSVSAQENSERVGQGFSPEDDLDCALYVASLMGEDRGVLTPDVQTAYLSAMTYFLGRYEAQRGTPINVAMAKRYPAFRERDPVEVEQLCGLRTRGFASRLEVVGRAMAEAQSEYGAREDSSGQR